MSLASASGHWWCAEDELGLSGREQECLPSATQPHEQCRGKAQCKGFRRTGNGDVGVVGQIVRGVGETAKLRYQIVFVHL